MPKQKHKPLRMCVSCREMKPKEELIKIVKNKDGEISIDPTGKRPGRGAYICKKEECLLAARKGKRIERAFKCAIDPQIYDSISDLVSKEVD